MDEIPETYTCSQEEQAPRTVQSRKRQIDSDSDSDSESDDRPLIKRVRLTRKNLSLFDKMGKKKAPESTDESGSTRTTSTTTTTSGFADKAYKNSILPLINSKTPTNRKARCEQNAQSRGTASPTESVHERYVNTVAKAPNKATIVVETSKLLKEYDDNGYNRAFNQAFTAFPRDIGFNNSLSTPQPDFIEGLEKREYLPFPIDEYVSGGILYKGNPHSLALPYIAGEWKGPDGGSMRTAELQSSYDGAALVYARNQALTYLGKSDPPGYAAITTFTINGTNLNLFAHYAAKTEDKTLEYHQYLDASYNLMKFDEYRDGRRHLRNAQDDVRDQSYALRDQLKEHWKQRSILPSVTEGSPLPTPALEPADAYKETTQYEDEAGYEIVEQPYQPTPTASIKPHGTSPPHSSRSSHNSGNDSHKRKASSL